MRTIKLKIAASLALQGAALEAGLNAPTYLTKEELRMLPTRRREAAEDWEAKRRNSCCAHTTTRGWRIAIGQEALPKVYNIHDLKKELTVKHQQFRYITPSGMRLNVRAFRTLCNELVDKARVRKNAEAVA